MRERTPRSGWTILELAIVVTIIGLLAALAIPLFSVILKKSRFSALANDLRVHATAIQTYAGEYGSYPASFSTPGAFIPELEALDERLQSTSWLQPTPVGGAFTWVYIAPSGTSRGSAYIQLVEQPNNPFRITLAQFVELDKAIDDGNIATGYLQVAGNRIRYFLQLGD